MRSAGEVCTEAKAKELGLYDIPSAMDDVRTYSSTNSADYTKKEAVCRITDDRRAAYPMCAIEHGFAFSQVPGDLSRCMVPECPPGFTVGPNNTCLKPTSSILKNRTRICDEKLYDWYHIPHYHIGNTYRKSADGKCYRPCENAGYVPLVAEDPVDKAKWAVEFSTPEVVKTDGSLCVNVKDYFNGKYASSADAGTEYCPIAVVKRLAVHTNGLKEELKEVARESLDVLEDQLPSATKVRINTNIASEASKVAGDTKKNLRNVRAGTPQMGVACSRLVDDEEITKLHGVCKILKETPSAIYNHWRSDNANATDRILKTRRTVMEQACHEVFCNNPNNVMIAGGNPVCFTPQKVSQADLDEHNNEVNASILLRDQRSGDAPSTSLPSVFGKIPDMKPVTNLYVKNMLRILASIFLILFFILFIFVCIKFWNWFINFHGTRADAAQAQAAAKTPTE